MQNARKIQSQKPQNTASTEKSHTGNIINN